MPFSVFKNALLVTVAGLPFVANGSDLEVLRTQYFRDLYAPFLGKGNDLMSKVVDNRGNGYENLYGVRNFRVVLHGVMYRGGANNYYHRTNPRDNSNPLPPDGLHNLCEESFGQAVYLYTTNFKPQTVECRDRTGANNTLKYSQISVFQSSPGQKEILEKVYRCATGGEGCPIYTHCWNGWHASGMISALALRQFCGFSAERALQYWIDGTDSVSNSNYPSIKDAILNFEPYPEFKIPVEVSERICPQNPY